SLRGAVGDEAISTGGGHRRPEAASLRNARPGGRPSGDRNDTLCRIDGFMTCGSAMPVGDYPNSVEIDFAALSCRSSVDAAMTGLGRARCLDPFFKRDTSFGVILSDHGVHSYAHRRD